MHPAVLAPVTGWRISLLRLNARVAGVMSVLLLATMAASAAAPTSDIVRSLDEARGQIEAVQKQVGKAQSNEELMKLRAAALAAQATADDASATLMPQLASVQARLTELGPIGASEARDIAEQRAQLERSRNELDADIKLAGLLSLEADQSIAQILAQRRLQFQARLGERTHSILGKAFWTQLRDDLHRDKRRFVDLGRELAGTLQSMSSLVWFGMLIAIAALVAACLAVGRRLFQLAATRVPSGRLRRSIRVLLQALSAAVTPALIMQAVHMALAWKGPLPERVDSLLSFMVGITAFGGYVVGLGRALLSHDQPTWQLPPIPDELAAALRRFPPQFTAVIVAIWLAETLASLIDISLPTTVAINCMGGFALYAVLARALRRVTRAHAQAALKSRGAETNTATPPRSFGFATVVGLSWIVLIVSLLCLLSGYVAFGSFVLKQVAWAGIVLSSAYLLMVLIDDGLMTVVASKPDVTDDRTARPLFIARDQGAVLLSAVGRICVAMFALTLLLAPFGAGPVELFQRVSRLQDGIAVGEIQLRPGAVAQALLVLLLAVAAVKGIKHWLVNRFLPTTRLDPGMRVSATTLVGYAGYVVAVALALSAMGMGLERVAWVASALSVGIGFGLQAVVQNFVSGLILLAERPVNVGDWVSLGGVEGDIRRINVRATEIQMGDRSTVIVPNSEFITKTVRNVTRANPLGLVQIKLPMPLGTDAEFVRSLMLAAFEANGDVLDSPAPSVMLDAVDNAALTFNATGYVSSPRAVYGVRSALLFDVLRRLREAGVPMTKPPTMLISAAIETPVAKDGTRTPDGA